MRARFLLGAAGSGKTTRCLAEIRDLLKRNAGGPPLVFLAPKQATFQLERQLLADDSLSGFARLHILSFERLARFVFETLEAAPPPLLSDDGRVMVLRALLSGPGTELKVFHRSARRPGFARQLSLLLRELQQHQVTPVKLRALAQSRKVRSELREKLEDLSALQGNYSAWLAEKKVQDANCLLDLAAAALREAENPKLRIDSLYLDGFAEMTPQELDLLAAVLPFCESATLAFCLDEENATENEESWLSMWNTVRQTFQSCRRRVEALPEAKIEIQILPFNSERNRFSKSPALRSLEQHWQTRSDSGKAAGGSSSISIHSCANPEAEAVLAARELLKFVRAGNRFRDCAILVRGLESYHRPLGRVFRRYQIPFFLDQRESVAHHPMAELTRGALRTAVSDWENDDLFSALKAGFCPVEETEIDRLENAALEFGWRGKKWREPLPDESFERLRKKILPPFENFYGHLARRQFEPDGSQLAGIFRRLWDELEVGKTLERWSTSGEAPLAIGNRPSAIHASVLEQMNALLDNLELGFSNKGLPLRDWLPIIESGLANLTVGVIPPVLDEVLIGAIDRARNPDLKLAIVLGVNETVFPAAPAAPVILTETDRAELPIPLGPDLRAQISRERFYGYIACTRASEKLALTFSRSGEDGSILNPSPFVAHLGKIFPGLEIEEFQNEPGLAEVESLNEFAAAGRELLLMAPACERILNPAPSHGAEGTKGKDRAEGHGGIKMEGFFGITSSPQPSPPTGIGGEGDTAGASELLRLPALKRLVENLKQLREPDGEENLSPPIAGKLYGPVLRTSVNRLEEFASCPFRFFVSSGLRAEERKIFELDARERGSFQHDILKRFHEQTAAEGKRWRDLTPQEARDRVAKISERVIEEYRLGLFNETAQSRFAARALAESLQDFAAVTVTWLREQNEFEPVAAELSFGSKESPQTAWEIDLGKDGKLALNGRIDRVDLCRESNGNALAIVLDYKSSEKKLEPLLVEHGIQLQLLAYLSVLRHWKNPRDIFGVKELNPAGVFYVNLRGQFENGDSRDEVLAGRDEARRAAYRHTGRFDAAALDRLDGKGARDQFHYRLTDGGKLYANSIEALPHEAFQNLLDRVETQLREFGRAIFAGVANVNPYRKGNQKPCGYCDYSPACRIDPWTHKFRVLK